MFLWIGDLGFYSSTWVHWGYHMIARRVKIALFRPVDGTGWWLLLSRCLSSSWIGFLTAR